MTISTPTLLAQDGTTTDGNPISTGTVSFAANRKMVLVFVSSHGTAANAVVPVGITGPAGAGINFDATRSYQVGNQRVTVVTALPTAAGSGVFTVDFGRTMQAMQWHIFQFAAGQVIDSGTIRQIKVADYPASSANVSVTLDSAPTAGNAIMIVESAGSVTITYAPPTGITQLGASVFTATPSTGSGAFWQATPTQTVSINSEQASPSKVLVAFEIRAAEGTNAPPVADLTADKATPVGGDVVTLDASGSTDADGTITGYAFTRIAGPSSISLSGSGATRTFTAPTVTSNTTATFQVVVTDNTGQTDTDTVSVTLTPAGALLFERSAGSGTAWTATPPGYTETGGVLTFAPADAVAGYATKTGLALTGATVRFDGLYFPVLPAGATVVLGPQSVAGTRALDLTINATGKLVLRTAANAIPTGGTMATAMTVGTAPKYDVEVRTDGDTAATINLYTFGGTVPIDTITVTGQPAGTFAGWNTFRVGASAQTPGFSWSVANIRLKNNASGLGPWSGAPQPPMVSLTVSPDSDVQAGDLLTLTATIAPTSGATIIGTVWTAADGATLVGSGNATRTVAAPGLVNAGQATYAVTATDSNGQSTTAVTSVDVSALRYPRGGFLHLAGVERGFYLPASSPPAAVEVTITGTVVGDGTVTVSWSVASNGRAVDGVYVGRDGVSAGGYGAYETALITPGLTGSQTFSNLVNDSPYEIHVTPVVLGVRQDPATVTLTPDVPTVQTKGLGMYRGAPGTNPDQAYRTQYGDWPMFTLTYIHNEAINETYESARVARGTSVAIDLDTLGTPGLLAAVADWTTQGQTWLIPKLQAAQRVAAAGKAAGSDAVVYIGFVHEWDIKKNQGKWTSRDGDYAVWGQAWNRVVQEARSAAPDCVIAFWVGGYTTATVGSMLAEMDEAPGVCTFDIYLTKSNSYASATSKWTAYVNFLTGHAKYQQWDSPPLLVTETGADRSLGDTAVTNFVNSIPAAMSSLGIDKVSYFSVDRTDTVAGGATNDVFYDLFTTATNPTPNAKTAFGTQVATLRGNTGVTVPVNVTLPAISVVPKVGEVATGTNGNWTGNPDSYAIQWLVAGVVKGTSASGYAPVAADGGKQLTRRVVAHNSAGDSQPATSTGVTILAASNPGLWDPLYTLNFASEPAGVAYDPGARPTVHQGINRRANVLYGPDGLTIIANRDTTGAEPGQGGPRINTGDITLENHPHPQHSRLEWDMYFTGYLGPGMFPAVWGTTHGSGPQGEKDYYEYGGAFNGAYNEVKMTAIFTPYGSGQRQTVLRYALNFPGYKSKAAEPNRMNVFGGFHRYRVDITPNSWAMFVDGNQVIESSNRKTMGPETYQLDNASRIAGGEANRWASQMENGSSWDPRFCYQVGNGSGNSNAGAVPTDWLRSSMVIPYYAAWAYNP